VWSSPDFGHRVFCVSPGIGIPTSRGRFTPENKASLAGIAEKTIRHFSLEKHKRPHQTQSLETSFLTGEENTCLFGSAKTDHQTNQTADCHQKAARLRLRFFRQTPSHCAIRSEIAPRFQFDGRQADSEISGFGKPKHISESANSSDSVRCLQTKTDRQFH